MVNRSLIAFAQYWHLDRSAAFHDLLTEPMQPYADVEMRGWDGQAILPPVEPDRQYIFCQLLPPAEWLQKIPDQLIWIPMWDAEGYYPRKWDHFPKSLRIVAFSDAVYQRAAEAGLRTIYLKFFKNPQVFTQADWTGQRVLLYWNRTGLIGPPFIERLCETLKVDKLLFRGQTDPGYVDFATYSLLPRFGKTIVETLPVFKTRQEYLDATREANLFIAPRPAEGAGMAFLEAMARGCAVFAHDAVTMNEYILSGENGYLLRGHWSLDQWVYRLRLKLAQRHIAPLPPFMPTLRERDQDWRKIAGLNVEQLGRAARQQQQAGYQEWQAGIPQYAQFLLNL